MRNWGLFVVCFGLYLTMLAPLQSVSYIGIISGVFFMAVGIFMYRKGGQKR